MREEKILLNMIKALIRDARDTQHLGSGYYTCTPYISRYNQILKKVKEIFPEEKFLLETFSPLKTISSTDPLEKTKLMEKVIVEAGQLSAFLETVLEDRSIFRKRKGGEKK